METDAMATATVAIGIVTVLQTSKVSNPIYCLYTAENPYSSCQGAAHVRLRRFPACQTGKPGQTFELAQTVWHPTTIGESANS